MLLIVDNSFVFLHKLFDSIVGLIHGQIFPINTVNVGIKIYQQIICHARDFCDEESVVSLHSRCPICFFLPLRNLYDFGCVVVAQRTAFNAEFGFEWVLLEECPHGEFEVMLHIVDFAVEFGPESLKLRVQSVVYSDEVFTVHAGASF